MTSPKFHDSLSLPESGPGTAAAGQRVPEVLHHMAFALSGHVRRLHFQGIAVPPEVEELAAFLRRLARTRQESPAVANMSGTGHYSRMPNQLLITKGEAAERLGVSVRTLERLVATGRVPQVQIERLARFRVKDLESYVDGLVQTRTDVDEHGDEGEATANIGAAVTGRNGPTH